MVGGKWWKSSRATLADLTSYSPSAPFPLLCQLVWKLFLLYYHCGEQTFSFICVCIKLGKSRIGRDLHGSSEDQLYLYRSWQVTLIFFLKSSNNGITILSPNNLFQLLLPLHFPGILEPCFATGGPCQLFFALSILDIENWWFAFQCILRTLFCWAKSYLNCFAQTGKRTLAEILIVLDQERTH